MQFSLLFPPPWTHSEWYNKRGRRVIFNKALKLPSKATEVERKTATELFIYSRFSRVGKAKRGKLNIFLKAFFFEKRGIWNLLLGIIWDWLGAIKVPIKLIQLHGEKRRFKTLSSGNLMKLLWTILCHFHIFFFALGQSAPHQSQPAIDDVLEARISAIQFYGMVGYNKAKEHISIIRGDSLKCEYEWNLWKIKMFLLFLLSPRTEAQFYVFVTLFRFFLLHTPPDDVIVKSFHFTSVLCVSLHL